MKNKIQQEELDWSTGKVSGFAGKELLNLQNGSVKLVEIDSMANYPEHIHPDKTEFAYVLQGTPDFIIGTESFTSKIGDFFIFPTNEKHAILNRSNSKCMLLVGAISAK